jgi:hypothetical protein
MVRRAINLPKRSPREWASRNTARHTYPGAQPYRLRRDKTGFLNLEIFDGEDAAESVFNEEGHFLKIRGTLYL